jgi:uncharacterized protein (UPF0332 family)
LPNITEHRTKAEENEFFVQSLQNPFWDWAVTGTFYAALHYVDAYLATKRIDPATHIIRNGFVKSEAVLNPLWGDYRELLNESRTARYDAGTTITQGDVTRLQNNLNAIKAVVLPLIK